MSNTDTTTTTTTHLIRLAGRVRNDQGDTVGPVVTVTILGRGRYMEDVIRTYLAVNGDRFAPTGEVVQHVVLAEDAAFAVVP